MPELPGAWPEVHHPNVRAVLTWNARPGRVRHREDVWTSEAPDRFSIGWTRYADYELRRSSEGRGRVEVVHDEVSAEEAALAFAISVLPLGLPLFGLEPLHGAAVELPGGDAFLVLGRSGSGKSTTAAALIELGCSLLGDDACALDDEGNLWPGPPVYAASMAEGRDETGIRYDGKDVVFVDGLDAGPRRVRGAVILGPAAGVALDVTALGGPEAMTSVLGQVRAGWALKDHRPERQFTAVASLARAGVGRLRYDPERHAPDAVARTARSWTAHATVAPPS